MEWVLLVAIVILCVHYFRHREEKRIEAAAEPVIAAALATHARALYIQREQLKKIDPYGNVDYAKFFEHLPYFIENVIARDLRENRLDVSILKNQRYVKDLLTRIGWAIVAEAEKEQEHDLSLVKTGIEYELFCKQKLERAGWSVRTTPATGDQGADLIAEKNGLITILQCKFWSQPVGNKAVQEAYAAKAFHKADFAAVVTNAAYTAAAQQLAQTSAVLLLHHQALSDLDNQLTCNHSASLVSN